MSKIDKGAIYEKYVCNYINNSKNNNKTAYLWKDVPDFILFNFKLIDDIDDCRINRETINLKKLSFFKLIIKAKIKNHRFLFFCRNL